MTFHCNVSNIKSSVIFKVNAYVGNGDVMTLMGKWISTGLCSFISRDPTAVCVDFTDDHLFCKNNLILKLVSIHLAPLAKDSW